jgi:hypothetical protein
MPTDRKTPDPEPSRPEVPTDFADVEDEALNALSEQLTTEFDKLVDEGSRDVAALTALADDIDRIKAETTARAEAEKQADLDVAALTERVRGKSEDTPVATDADPEPVAAPDPDPPIAAETPDPELDPEKDKDKDKVLVTASVRPAPRPALGDVARRVPRPRVESKRSLVTITAAADLPGVSPGTAIDMTQLATSMHDRARVLSDDGRRAPVARIDIPHTHELGTNPEANVATIDDLVGKPDAAALVASGGWCAPSEPVFEMFDITPDASNVFDLPGLGTKVRAGVMIPSFYGIGDVGGALWTWTEANDIAAATQPAGPEKPCLKIPCPTWTECRLEAEGLCVTHGNLSDRAWPELTSGFLSIVMAAHQRRMSAAKIAKVLGDIGATTTPDATMLLGDVTADVLNIIALAAEDMRSQYRLAKGRSVDVLLPDWARSVLRENMAHRAGVTDSMNVSDSQVTSWLTARGIRPQFTPDWQPLYNAAPATRWPATLVFALWLTGSYIALDGGSIDLGVVRDSTLNATNDFTAAWSEQFYQVCRRGPKGRTYTVPVLVDGVTGCCPAAA